MPFKAGQPATFDRFNHMFTFKVMERSQGAGDAFLSILCFFSWGVPQRLSEYFLGGGGGGWIQSLLKLQGSYIAANQFFLGGGGGMGQIWCNQLQPCLPPRCSLLSVQCARSSSLLVLSENAMGGVRAMTLPPFPTVPDQLSVMLGRLCKHSLTPFLSFRGGGSP